MRTRPVLAAALAAALAATPVLAQENRPGYRLPPAPEAADKSLGMAVLSAAVLAGCSGLSGEVRGAGVVSAQKISAGICQVKFIRSVRGCVQVASPGGFTTYASSSRYSAHADYVDGAENDDIVAVRTFDSADAPTDSSFHLIVFCAQ